jgi:uncharacterized membrane protein
MSVYVNHDVLDLVTGRRPEVARSSRVRAQAQLNRVVQLVMRLGLVASGGLLLLGAALALALGQRLPTVDPAPLEALSRALRLEPAGLLVLGVGVLVATPIVSLTACLGVFVGRRDWRYAAITGLVLSITLLSIAVGAS